MTLTAIALITKRSIKLIVISLIIGTVSLVGFRIWYANYLASLPPPEIKPDLRFGLLPHPDFPEAQVSSSNYSYSLDTTTGGFPKLDKLIKVYFMPKTFATLLSSEKAEQVAEKFGIKSTPQILSETQYKFTEGNKTLTIDIDSGNFIYTKALGGEATLSASLSNEKEGLVEQFKNTLSFLEVIKEDLTSRPNKVVLKQDGERVISYLIPLWPKDLDGKITLNQDINKSLINAEIMGPADNLDNYLSLNFTYWPIDTTTFSTYPIKTPQQAFEDLKNGKGIVVAEPLDPKVSITSVYLAYYQSLNYSPYLLPIYVFEGPNFVSYIEAISEEHQSPSNNNLNTPIQ